MANKNDSVKNLPGIFENKLDGNLTITPVNDAPKVLVLGQATQGTSETLFRVDKPSDSAKTFGKSGTLIRGMFEASIAGALNLRLFRFGATASVLAGVGDGSSTGGKTITTVRKDNSAGTDYEIFYDDAAGVDRGRLRVYRTSDNLLVFDDNPADLNSQIDIGEVTVDGTADLTGTAGDNTIGTVTVRETLLTATHAISSGPEFTAGTDGVDLSRMKVYENLHNAYELLDAADIDVVLPMDVQLDDLNVMEMSQATVSSLDLLSLTDYPTKNAGNDVLGKVFVQEFEGENRFWWWLPSVPNATDPDAQFVADGGAALFPISGVDLASSTTDSAGVTLTGTDFHEVNFAYQLANFCFLSSRDNTEMTGSIGVLPPKTFSLKDVSNWVGKLPTSAEDSNGKDVINIGGNGTGLLGNKFMSGRRADASTAGVPGLSIDGVDGLLNGGFIATDTGWLDDLQVKDDNDALRDLGKYITVVGTHPILSNPSRTASYTAPGNATYGGFYSQLPAESAPTNKLLRGLREPFRVKGSKLDLLAGQRYTMFQAKTRGVVVSDGPTAARPDSDYQRLSTVRQVKAAVDAVRRVADPFIGEGLTNSRISALDTAVDGALKSLVRQGVLVRYDSQVTATPQQRVLGQATAELVLVPAFELRQLTVVISLAAT